MIDREALGGGCEYIRRKCAELPAGDEGRAFYSSRGECTPATLHAWGAERVVVNHLRAAVQLLLGSPLRKQVRPVFSRGIEFVVHGIHLHKYDFLPRTPANRVKSWLRRRLESWLYHRCDRIVALTPTDAADIKRLYGEDLHVVVEPNTLGDWTPVDMKCDYNGETFEHVFIGRFNFQKGQDRWLRHLAEHPEVPGRTLFIGDGETLAECRRFAEERGLVDRVVFAGAIPEAERYLPCARHVVSTSRWEGMPYLLMKAVACGCDIIATDCSGNRDVLQGYAKWTVFREGEES